jgi:hypothetical protein
MAQGLCSKSENDAHFRNGQVGVHDDNRTGEPSTSRMNMNLTQEQKLIFKYR